MALHPISGAIVSADVRGILEYWLPCHGGTFPDSATKFSSKFKTDLFSLARKKIRPKSIAMSPNGNYFAISCSDAIVRVFHFRTGKLRREFDEVSEEQKMSNLQEEETADQNGLQRRQAMKRTYLKQ